MSIDKDLIKKFGKGAFISGDELCNHTNETIHVSPRIDLLLGGGIPGGSVVTLAGDPKCGKGLPLSAKVMTPSGPEQMGSIELEDEVCTPDGKTAKVCGVFKQGIRPTFKITFSNGDTCICDDNHLWKTKRHPDSMNWEVISITEMANLFSEGYELEIPSVDICKFSEKYVSLSPFILGCAICSNNEDGSTSDSYVNEELEKLGLIGISKKDRYIPDIYKYNNTDRRRRILEGINLQLNNDSDEPHYKVMSNRLANDIKDIYQSLGMTCHIIETYEDNIQFFECKVSWKWDGFGTRRIINIEKGEETETVCIKLDNEDGLFITDNFIVTHNTVTALHILGKAQQAGRQAFYINVEGRIKPRDLDGISCLDTSKLNIVRSYRDNSGQSHILKADEFLSIVENIVHNVPGAVIVIDSISQLVTSGEVDGELGKQDRAPGAMLMAKFCRRISNVLPVNDIVLIGILHFIANTSGYGKVKFASGGNKIKYAMDVGLECKKYTIMRDGTTSDEGNPIGQEVTWVTTSTAFAPPGQSGTSMITYGTGIDEVYEMVDIGIDCGFIEKAASWFTMSYMKEIIGDSFTEKDYRCQGKPKLSARLKENKEEREALEKALHKMLGF
jgi:recombination protein RecA